MVHLHMVGLEWVWSEWWCSSVLLIIFAKLHFSPAIQPELPHDQDIDLLVSLFQAGRCENISITILLLENYWLYIWYLFLSQFWVTLFLSYYAMPLHSWNKGIEWVWTQNLGIKMYYQIWIMHEDTRKWDW